MIKDAMRKCWPLKIRECPASSRSYLLMFREYIGRKKEKKLFYGHHSTRQG